MGVKYPMCKHMSLFHIPHLDPLTRLICSTTVLTTVDRVHLHLWGRIFSKGNLLFIGFIALPLLYKQGSEQVTTM